MRLMIIANLWVYICLGGALSSQLAWSGYGFMEQRSKAKVLQQYDATGICKPAESFADFSDKVIRSESAQCRLDGARQLVLCQAGYGTEIKYYYFPDHIGCQEYRNSRLQPAQVKSKQ